MAHVMPQEILSSLNKSFLDGKGCVLTISNGEAFKWASLHNTVSGQSKNLQYSGAYLQHKMSININSSVH